MLNDFSYVVATIKDWNVKQYFKDVSNLPGRWHLITSQKDLNVENLEAISPRYIFFPHWSWIVPKEILSRWECVCFHMADVPYGRGGSPLQNLILNGHVDTRLTALRMEEELDAGPVYKKLSMSLEGSAQNIFERAAPKVFELIHYIVTEQPAPQEQKGEVTVFKRRTPEQSEIPPSGELSSIYNYIRMLDAETYPRAYVDYGDYRIEFEKASIKGDSVVANARISLRKSR